MGLIDGYFEISKGDSKSYRIVSEKLQLEIIDVIISPHESLRTSFFIRSLTAKEKWSFKKPWSFLFFNKTLVKNLKIPDALRQLSLLSLGNSEVKEQINDYLLNGRPYEADENGILTSPPFWAAMSCQDELNRIIPNFWPGMGERYPEIFKIFNSQSPVALIFPGSVWATKRWTEEGFIKAANELKNRGYQIVIMGGPGEEELAQNISKKINIHLDLTGKTTIVESALIVLKAQLVIANDSASAHLASIADTAVVSIFGPTIIEFGFRPWGKNIFVVENKELNCRPCGKHGHKKCPLGTHECMKSISAEQVLSGVSVLEKALK